MSDCVFCQKIINQDPDTSIYADDQVASFEPLNPVAPGHRLFIPTNHVEHGDGIDAACGLSRAINVASLYAQAWGDDFNLITSSGPSATQTIPHIHIHYVPRHAGDGLHLPWTENAHE